MTGGDERNIAIFCVAEHGPTHRARHVVVNDIGLESVDVLLDDIVSEGRDVKAVFVEKAGEFNFFVWYGMDLVWI